MTDKIKHILISTGIAILFSLFVGLWAFPATLLIGLSKELIWDKWMKRGQFEWGDLICDLWGATFGSILGLIINILLEQWLF